MKRAIFLLGTLILTAALLLACNGGASSNGEVVGTEVAVDGGSYWNVSPAQLSKMLEDKDFLMINTDPIYMGEPIYTGEIPGTDLLISGDQIEENLSQLPQDKSEKIVLYCQVGTISSTVAARLVELGFTNVWSLDGGMAEWDNQGYPVIVRQQ